MRCRDDQTRPRLLFFAPSSIIHSSTFFSVHRFIRNTFLLVCHEVRDSTYTLETSQYNYGSFYWSYLIGYLIFLIHLWVYKNLNYFFDNTIVDAVLSVLHKYPAVIITFF